jgi:hypothetical protein
MNDSADTVVDLGNGINVRCTSTTATSLLVEIFWRHFRLLRSHVSPDRRADHAQFGNALIRSDIGIDMDFFAGLLTWTAKIDVHVPFVGWQTPIDINDDILVRFDPSIGEIDGQTTVNAPVVDDPVWGRSKLTSPTILRLHVADQHRQLADVGRIVKNGLFSDYPPFTFNVVACCGHTADGKPGLYGDPLSPWFNIFFGIYQVDCSKTDWTRPFGYESHAGAASIIRIDDLVRLGKADWNWFSNYLYGVPPSACEQFGSVEVGDVQATPQLTIDIGGRRWHRLTLAGLQVVSCYQSNAPGAAVLVDNTPAAAVWREAFGQPCPRPNFDKSFVATDITATFEMACWEDANAFHTIFFGGTSGTSTAPGFIAAQLQATESVITNFYADRGFEP